MTKEETHQLQEVVVKLDELFKITCGCGADCKIKNPTFHTLDDLLDYVRINVKYLMFDLEATRRELAHVQKTLQDDIDKGHNV